MTQSPRFIAKNVNHSGFLLGYVDDVKMATLLKKFPEGRMEGCGEFEKGYDEDDLGFEDTQTKSQFHVYSRWGNVRIGGVDQEGVAELTKFLQS